VGVPLSVRSASAPLTNTLLRVSPRAATFWAVFAAYAALTVCVLFESPVLSFDTYLVNLHLWHRHPGYHPWINGYVMFGQRGPATLAFVPLFCWVAWRERSSRPLVMLGTALVLLNLSVGAVKYAVGRVGPMHVHGEDVHQLFAGGTIYPSGHVSNTVVLYGLVAWIVPRFRKTAIAAAVFLSITVGLGTVYLRTHWFSDVVGGWFAGALVLIALPSVMPTTQRWADTATAWARRRWAARRAVSPHTPARAPQRVATPVSSVASSHNFAATVSSLDALEDPTRVG
jgi:membrane-associated phospholipid phosphatase